MAAAKKALGVFAGGSVDGDGDTPPPRTKRNTVHEVRELVVFLWTRLNDVSWRAKMISARQEPFSDETRATLARIADLSDVRGAYDHMVRLFEEAAATDVPPPSARSQLLGITNVPPVRPTISPTQPNAIASEP